jgi:hypothetical protein
MLRTTHKTYHRVLDVGVWAEEWVVEWLADLLEVAEWVVAEVAAIAVVADPLIKMNRGCKSPLFINICRKNINTKVSLDV